jgi:EmrB/QacA subfamily drug resistance transporter
MRRALVILILGTLMTGLDATVTNVAMNTLSRGFHASVANTQWVISGYLLAVAAVIPVSGWAARRYTPRYVYMAGLGLFTLSSGLCASAHSLPMLVIFRVLQGAAAGLITPLNQLIAAEVAGPDRMARTVSTIWSITSISSILGPTLGGVIISGIGWRWIFLINVPLGLGATIAAFWMLPPTPARPAGRLDVAGAVRLLLGMPLIVFALTEAEAHGGFDQPASYVPLLAGGVLVADFVRHALSVSNPLLDLGLYRRRLFAAGSASLFLFDVAWFGVLLLEPLYFQQVRHAGPALAGLLIGPQGIGSAVGNILSGRIKNPRRARMCGVIGATVFTFTTASLTFAGAGASYGFLCPLLFIAGIGAGCCWVPATAAGYVGLSAEEISHASPLVAVVMRLGASFGTTLAAIVLQAELTHRGAVGAPHLVSAFHSTFAWAVLAAIVAAGAFVVLARARPPTPALRPGPAGGTDEPEFVSGSTAQSS